MIFCKPIFLKMSRGNIFKKHVKRFCRDWEHQNQTTNHHNKSFFNQDRPQRNQELTMLTLQGQHKEQLRAWGSPEVKVRPIGQRGLVHQVMARSSHHCSETIPWYQRYKCEYRNKMCSWKTRCCCQLVTPCVQLRLRLRLLLGVLLRTLYTSTHGDMAIQL